MRDNPEFFVGDRVIILKNEKSTWGFIGRMPCYVGMKTEITKTVYDEFTNKYAYKILADNEAYWWDDKCFERILDVPDLPEFSAEKSIDLLLM